MASGVTMMPGAIAFRRAPAFAPLDALDHDTLLVTAFCQLVGIILPFLMKIKSDFSMCSVESPITTD